VGWHRGSGGGGAQGVWGREVPQRGPGAESLVGSSGGIGSRKLIAVIKDIWLPNHAQFCVFSSTEFSCEPNFGGGACPPLAASLEPIAVETLGVLNSSANSLLKEIGNKI